MTTNKSEINIQYEDVSSTNIKSNNNNSETATQNISNLNLNKLSVFCALSCYAIDALMYPLDTLKTKLQNNRNEFLSFRKGFKMYYQQEGIMTFYKGFNTVFPCSFITNYFWFYCYEYCNKHQISLLKRFIKNENYHNYIKNIFPFLSGMAAEFVAIVIYLPFDLVRIRMQVNDKSYQYNGVMDGLNKVYQTEGLKRFFQASHLFITTSVLYSGIQFGIYEYLRKRLLLAKNGKELRLWDTISITFLTSFIVNIGINPFDLIMTRYQMVNNQVEILKVSKILKELLKNEGIIALYKGFTSKLFMSLSHSLFYMPVYEYFRVKYGVLLNE